MKKEKESNEDVEFADTLRLRYAFPQFHENELESIAQYFEIALEIAAQDLIGGEVGFDIAPPISTLKERSNSNLKDQS